MVRAESIVTFAMGEKDKLKTICFAPEELGGEDALAYLGLNMKLEAFSPGMEPILCVEVSEIKSKLEAFTRNEKEDFETRKYVLDSIVKSIGKWDEALRDMYDKLDTSVFNTIKSIKI